MKNILAFCFFPAFVPPSNGGQSRLFHFYRALSRWHRITLITSSHIGVDEEIINHGINFVERRIPKDNFFVQEYTRLDQYASGGDLSGPAIAACSKLPTRLHEAYLEEYEKAHTLIFDDPFTAQYDLFAGTDAKLRIYNSYNCESLLYEQLHPATHSRPIHDLVRNAEERILAIADLVLYCNDGDLSEFRKMSPDATFEALYTPNGLTPHALAESVSIPSNKKARAVFMGSGHPPNAQAAEFIAHKLATELPTITFEIIGSCLPEGRYSSNLKRHGVVDDATKSKILQSSDLALNPMAAGSGSNVKVLEYFAYGLPVLSTTFGMRGIQAEAGREYLEASLENFAHAIRSAVLDSDSLAAIAQAGKELAASRYSWDTIARPVAEYVDRLARGRAQDKQTSFVLALNDYDSFSGVGGGCTRTRGIYEVVREWSPVVFISFSSDGTLGARQEAKGIIAINIPKTSEHIAEESYFNSHFHISSNDIIASRHCTSNQWLEAVYRVLRQSARCIVVEHCYIARVPITWGDRFIYSSQNDETELKKSLLQWHPLKAELLNEVEISERLAVEHSAATIAVSHEDAANLARRKHTAGPIIVVPNGASMPAPRPDLDEASKILRKRIGNRSVVFLGSAHMPNIESAKFIVEKLAPQCPDVQFHLLGSICDSILHQPKNVTLWGVVDDLTKNAVFSLCAFALNPMNSGSGSNVKLADYLIHGLFVITTHFGQRGYPASIQDHIVVAPIDSFSVAVLKAFEDPQLNSPEKRAQRSAIFSSELTMRGIAKRFVETLQSLETPKKKVLYVTYRYASPALGGAETNIEQFVTALGKCGKFDVDVVAPEVTGIHNQMRFSESYSFDPDFSVPIDIPNVRFARFPIDEPSKDKMDLQLRRAWGVQPHFEKVVDRLIGDHYEDTGITWGWGHPEGEDLGAARWAFTECGAFIHQPSEINLEGYAPQDSVLSIFSGDYLIAGPAPLRGAFSISFSANAGKLIFSVSAKQLELDPRPLGIRVSRLAINGKPLDLSLPTLLQNQLTSLTAEKIFRLLDQAAEESRTAHGVRLTDGRGPWSRGLESFITDHVADYDLVITHNNVFRPAVVAIEEARKKGVPSILIPHAHLDDDFYHFPDWLESARNASLVLVVPRAACDFLSEKGCNVRYLPAGCDADEEFTAEDKEAFEQVYQSPRRFILVLGRKAGAKGYRQIIDAVEQINSEGVDLQAVLIGPDDDGIPVDSPNAVYLGRQPRNVVRGALLSCIALCNMSVSESFGIVLLEAWLAGKPVIANKDCVAFKDLADDGVDALLADFKSLKGAIGKLIDNPNVCRRLAENGRKKTAVYDWEEINCQFVKFCEKDQ